jgi:hypothetical protein
MMVATFRTSGDAFVASKPSLRARRRTRALTSISLRTRFVVVQAVASDQRVPEHVVLLLHFFDELRRRAPANR